MTTGMHVHPVLPGQDEKTPQQISSLCSQSQKKKNSKKNSKTQHCRKTFSHNCESKNGITVLLYVQNLN